MTAMEENVDDRFAGIDIDSLLSRSNPRPLNCGRRKALYESPEFIQRLNGEETVLEGQSLVLECKVAGFPVPVLRWFKDDEEIIDHPRIRVEGDGKGTYCLLIDSVHKGDEAAYRCRAENVEGTCSSCFFLSVKAKRRSQKKKRKKDSKSGTKRTVSFPPMFATIVEKVEEEEKQGKELELLPPSPMTDFYYALTLKGRQSWPAFLGDWAFVDEDGRERVPPDRAMSMPNGSPEPGQFRSPGQGRVAARRSMRRGDQARESSKKQKLEEDARIQKEEEEKNKNRKEEEEMKKKNQLIEEEKTRQEEREREEEKKREEAMRRRKKLREERVAKQEEERKRKEEEELMKKKEDDERKRKAEEEEKRRREEKRREQEALKVEEEKRKAASQKAKEEERLREEKKRREVEKQKEETESRNKEIKERKRKDEEKRKEEEAIKEAERRKEEEQRKRDADIAKKKDEQMKLLQQKKKEDELRKQKEAEDKRKELQKAEEDKRKNVVDASKKLEAKEKEQEDKQIQDGKIKFEHEKHVPGRNGKEELDKGKQMDTKAKLTQARPSGQKSVLQRFGKHLDGADQLKSNRSSDMQGKGRPKLNELPGQDKPNVARQNATTGHLDKSGTASKPVHPEKSEGVVGLTHPGLHKAGSAANSSSVNQTKPVSDHGRTDRDTKPGVSRDKIIGTEKSKMAAGKANIPKIGEAEGSRRQAGGASSEKSTEQGGKIGSQEKGLAKCERTEEQRDLTKQKQQLQKKELVLKREEEDKKRKELEEKQKRDDLLLQKKKEKIRKEQLWRQHEEEERKRMKKEAEKMSRKTEEEREKKKEKLASGEVGTAAGEEDEFSVKVYKRDYSFADLRKSLESHLGADVMDPEEHKYWDEILEKHDYSILDLKKSFDTGGISESSERMSRARVRRNSIELETEIFRVKRSSSITDLRESFTNSLDRPKKKSEAQKKRQKDEEFLKRAPPLQDLRQQFLETHKPELVSSESTVTSQSASATVKPSAKVSSSLSLSSSSSSSSLISSHIPSSSSSSSSVSTTNTSQTSSLLTRQSASSTNVSKNMAPRTELAKMAGSVASKRASFHEMLSHTTRSQVVNDDVRDKARKRISYHGYDVYGSREIPAYQRVAAWSDDIGKSRTNANFNAGRQDKLTTGSEHQNIDEDNDTRVRPFVYNSIRTIARKFTKKE